MPGREWSESEVRALGVRTDLVTACSVLFGAGRTTAYEMYRKGELPFRTLRLGSKVVVPVKDLLVLLGLDPDG